MMIRNVGKAVSSLMDDHKKTLGVRPNAQYLRYLVLQFEAQYKEHGMEFMKKTADGYANADKYPPGELASFKDIRQMTPNVQRRFSSYANLLGMEQADFLRFLVYQDRDFIEEHGEKTMQKVAQSYGGTS